MSVKQLDQRFAPPQAHVEDLAPAGQDELAGRGIRLVAGILDGLMAWGLSTLVYLIEPIKRLAPEPEGLGWNFSVFFVGIPLFLLLQAWPLLKHGQTLGKVICKLRIVRTDGARATAWQLLGLRYGVGFVLCVHTGLAMVYGLLDALLIFRKSRQCLHDTIAGTKVIKVRKSTAA